MQSTKSDYNSIDTPRVSIDQFMVNAKSAKSENKSKTKREQKTESNENEHEQDNSNESKSLTTDPDDESMVLEPDTDSNDYRQNWWKQSVTKYALNLPKVRANLARLVSTDEVKLNDHQFMMNLRASVWNDFDEKLNERVKQREAKEIERTKKLILKCKYNQYNCPKKLLPLHSQVLVLDLQDEPIKLDTSVQTDQSRKYDGPVFNINRKTNAAIYARRRRTTTIRKRNFENLMRHVLRDFKLSEKLEYDETRAIQDRIKSIHDSEKKKKYSKHLAFIAKMVNKVKSMLKF